MSGSIITGSYVARLPKRGSLYTFGCVAVTEAGDFIQLITDKKAPAIRSAAALVGRPASLVRPAVAIERHNIIWRSGQ